MKFAKEVLVVRLHEAKIRHTDFADGVRSVADASPNFSLLNV
jgi:hypothetical protein